ncbi:hypothetical protein [Cupriavidus agavae]|uniref:hypothetical protein n=1 Tax=Cupriavidus agavae TaxID=1001822 RepID=UPI00102B8B3D|nr:hypothetical protein [Cupriavidus agavae]
MSNTVEPYIYWQRLVRDQFQLGIRDGNLRPYQAFAYTYDELETVLSEGIFTRCCLLVALFMRAREAHICFEYDDPFTEDVLLELEGSAKEFDAHREEFPFCQDRELIGDLAVVRETYLKPFSDSRARCGR